MIAHEEVPYCRAAKTSSDPATSIHPDGTLCWDLAQAACAFCRASSLCRSVSTCQDPCANSPTALNNGVRPKFLYRIVAPNADHTSAFVAWSPSPPPHGLGWPSPPPPPPPPSPPLPSSPPPPFPNYVLSRSSGTCQDACNSKPPSSSGGTWQCREDGMTYMIRNFGKNLWQSLVGPGKPWHKCPASSCVPPPPVVPATVPLRCRCDRLVLTAHALANSPLPVLGSL